MTNSVMRRSIGYNLPCALYKGFVAIELDEQWICGMIRITYKSRDNSDGKAEQIEVNTHI